MKKAVLLLAVIIALSACQSASTAKPIAPAATPTPLETATSAPADPTAKPISAATQTLPPAKASPTTAALAAETLPASKLFDVGWDERDIFAPGLIESEQTVLAELNGASVYHLDITLSQDMTQLNGQLAVRYTNQENDSLDEIYFRLYPNILAGKSTASNVKVNGKGVEPTFSLRNSAMAVPLPQPLEPGQQTVIEMDFAVEIPTTAAEENYASFGFVNDILAAAHFYPIIAVYDDEGWNVELPQPYGDMIYADSSFYITRITAPAEQKLITSGIEIETAANGDTQTVTFSAGPVRDFYLVSSNGFAELEETIGQTTIRSFAPPHVSESNQNALGFAADAMRVYDDAFGAYPFTELDLVATPTLAGGIEYPGVIVVALGLYENPNPFFESAAAHEVGHQWFYSAVGNDQVDEPWLDESLTQYATWLYYRQLYGQQGDTGYEQAMEDRWNRVGRADIPIGMPVSEYTPNQYGAIVYGRGPLFFEALAEEMGQETFAAFLKDYYQSFKWQTVNGKQFQTLAEEHCDCDLSAIFEEWVY